jgi:hypothetical protein
MWDEKEGRLKMERDGGEKVFSPSLLSPLSSSYPYCASVMPVSARMGRAAKARLDLKKRREERERKWEDGWMERLGWKEGRKERPTKRLFFALPVQVVDQGERAQGRE